MGRPNVTATPRMLHFIRRFIYIIMLLKTRLATVVLECESFQVPLRPTTTTFMKRRASLIGRPSPFHAGVTLFEPTNDAASGMMVRRSKRLRVTSGSEASATTPPRLANPDPYEERYTSGSSLTIPQSLEGIADAESAPVSPPTGRQAPRKARATKSGIKAQALPASGTSKPPADMEDRPIPKRASSSRKPKAIPTALETPHPAPARWRETYDTVKRMRARIVAPVDTMGCEQAQLKETEPKVFFTPSFTQKRGVELVANRHVTEPALLHARFAHALVADEGRGD